MKKINIFLSAEEEILKNEKIELSNFIRDLNDKYEKYDIYFRLLTGDNEKSVEEQGIGNCELFFILFCKSLSQKTISKFQFAYDNFKKHDIPKILTYIKLTDNKPDTSILDFMKHLDKDLGHYYSTYENIDTVKLNILFSLRALNLDCLNIEAKDNKLFVDDKEVITLENIPSIYNNKQLSSLKKEYEKLEDDYISLKEKVHENPDDNDLFDEYEKITEKRNSIKKEIYNLEKTIIDIESSFIEKNLKDGLSKRQIYAKKCLEKGDIEEAKNALDLNEILDDANKIININKKRRSSLQININELMQRIDTLRLDIDNKNRFYEIEEIFKEAIRIEKEGGLERKTLVTYAEFLIYRENYDKALEYAFKYLNYLNLEDIKVDLAIYKLIAECYKGIGNYDEAICYYNKALDVITKEEKNLFNLHTTIRLYNNIAYIYNINENYLEALTYYKKVATIKENILSSPSDYLSLLYTYNIIADIYYYIKNTDEAISYLYKALNLVKDLHIEDEEFESLRIYHMSNIYKSLARIYNKLQNDDEELKFNFEIIKLLGTAKKGDINLFINSYQNIINIYIKNKNNNKAEFYILKAVKYEEKYNKLKSFDFTNELLSNYSTLAEIYKNKKDYDNAIKYYKKCLILDYTPNFYLNIAKAYIEKKDLIKAKKYILKTYALSLKSYEKLANIYYTAFMYEKAQDIFNICLSLINKIISIIYNEILTINNTKTKNKKISLLLKYKYLAKYLYKNIAICEKFAFIYNELNNTTEYKKYIEKKQVYINLYIKVCNKMISIYKKFNKPTKISKLNDKIHEQLKPN